MSEERKGAEHIIPSVNLETVIDGRGGIFTYIPDQALVEMNLVIIKAGKFRGEHFHKEFTEYFLIVQGLGVYLTRNASGEKSKKVVSGGDMLMIPPGVPHVVHAITDMYCVASLTKKWDDCIEPITICAGESI